MYEKEIKHLQFLKVFPKENYFDNKNHFFYIYCYLNPFKPEVHKYIINGKLVTFGYEPLYIGKASTNHGYRHNQHIAEFLKAQDSEEPQPTQPTQPMQSPNQSVNNLSSHNLIKMEKFKKLEEEMLKNQNPALPHNWTEYQSNWIIILSKYNNPTDLIEAEKNYIKTIGTIIKNSGPLTNAILG